MSPKETKSLARRALAILWMVGGVLVISVVALVFSLDNSSDIGEERTVRENATEALAESNRHAILIGCQQNNKLIVSVQQLAKQPTTNRSIPEELIASVVDPEIRRILTAISSNTVSNRDELIRAADAIEQQDCQKLVATTPTVSTRNR